MHRLLLLTLALVLPVAAFAQDLARMTQIVEAQTAGDKFMGSVVVAKAGDILFEKHPGWANLEWKIAHTPATKFRIGSVTKQFTAAAILLLADRGKLQLDDLVSKHLPDAPATWEKVTLYHLLTHTSGIPSVTSQPEYAVWKLSPSTPAESLAHVRDLPLEFTPGEKFAYSNSGYILLGQLIERISGSSYETFVTDSILKPLGMNDSGYDSNSALIAQRASGYVPGPNGLANAPYIDMHFPHAAGGLYSTTHDLLRWVDALFGGKLLSPASFEKMITPFKNDYACGVGVSTVRGRTVIQHGGGIEGFNAHLAYYPDSKLAVAVLANVNGSAASELAGQLAAVAFAEPVTLSEERQARDVPVERLQTYVGVYRLSPQITNSIRLVDGQLTTQLTGQPAFPLFPETESKFFLKVVDAQVEFSTDASGRVTHLTQHQAGRSQKAPRIADTVVERKAIEVAREIKATCVGTYELRPGFDLVITLENDQLMSKATGQPKVPIFPESETRFFFTSVDAQLEFFKNDQGAVTHLVLHQGSHELKGARK